MLNCEWVRTVDPTVEPITLSDAKVHLRMTHVEEDGLVRSYLIAAREAAEEALQRGLVTQTWQLTLDAFAEIIWLPMAAPLQSVTTVEYYNNDGVLTTLDPSFYTVDTVARPGRITRAPGMTWPSLESDRRSGCVVITYVVGWLSTADIPERYKQGMRLYLAACDVNREGPGDARLSAEQIAAPCWSDRVHWIPPQESC
jgi:uncharacterized phiE125 gp8 family phage protein